MSNHAVTMNVSELSIAIAKAKQRLATAEAACDVARETLHRLQAEREFRTGIPCEESIAGERTDSVAKGEVTPVPIATVPATQSRAAAVRLASLSITSSRRSTPVPVVAKSQAIKADHPPAATVVRGVSDHAVVRYLERVVGVDMTSIRSKIMTPFVERAIRSGVARIRTSDGVVVVREGVVTSFLPNENGPNRRKGRYIDRGRTQRRPRHVVEGDDEEWSGTSD